MAKTCPSGCSGPSDRPARGGRPLTGIARAADVHRVMVNGEPDTVEELLAPFAARSTAVAPRGRMLPPVPDHPSNRAYWWHDPHCLAGSKRSCCAQT